MGFFDDLPPIDTYPEPGLGGAWGVPLGAIGGWLPWRIVLVRTEKASATLQNFEAFPSGLLFQLVSRFDPSVLDVEDTPLGHGPWPATHPQIGVRFADGRKAATPAGIGAWPNSGDENLPVIRGRGGLGHEGEHRTDFWLWPLPPSGPLTWFAAWPEMGVDEVSVAIDASALSSAAAQTEQIWVHTGERGRMTDLRVVLRGNEPDGTEWSVLVGPDHSEDGALYTFVRRSRPGGRPAQSGMGGPKLYGHDVVNVWAGEADGTPPFVLLRAAPAVDAATVMTLGGALVDVTLSPVIEEFGLRFGAAALPDGDEPVTLNVKLADGNTTSVTVRRPPGHFAG